MNLNVRKLLREDAGRSEGSHVFDFSQEEFGHFKVAAPVRFSYAAQPAGSGLALHFSLATHVQAECARCLAPTGEELCVQKTYEITEQDLDEEFPELPLQNGMLDLAELAYGEIVLETPGLLLCSEDCPGLCPQCGKRAGGCGCTAPREIDPRLEVLLELLDEE